ncbi:NERD domain-containing protein [Sporolactobacillus sp. Y61]|uniref:NERD domain-containing protein n=1 Tax=Sporolactobacillus sp. Y61 TaxID=3160863 RepID=A0AAU8II62_9BACL
MECKKQYAPLRLLTAGALLDHLPPGWPGCMPIEEEHARRLTGWRGEQNLAYYLDLLTEDFRIFYGLRENAMNHFFQMDVLLIKENFALILEVKNYAGTLVFESATGQMIRLLNGRRDGFPNPIVQVHRQRDMMHVWLHARRLPQIPIEPLVIISSSSTIIENPSNSREVRDKVIHAEQVPFKLAMLMEKYKHSPTLSHLNQIERQLLEGHTDPPLNILEKYQILPDNLLRGVRCPHCHLFGMRRVYATWVCPRCGTASRTAHEQMILDYFLLCGETMTNKEGRWWLGTENRQLIHRLTQKMNINIAGSGRGAGQYYVRPSHEYFHQYDQMQRSMNRRIR